MLIQLILIFSFKNSCNPIEYFSTKKMILHLPHKSHHITEAILANVLSHKALSGSNMAVVWYKIFYAIQLKGDCASKWKKVWVARERSIALDI